MPTNGLAKITERKLTRDFPAPPGHHGLCFGASVLEDAGLAYAAIQAMSGNRVVVQINGIQQDEHKAILAKLAEVMTNYLAELERERTEGICLRCGRLRTEQE